MNRDFNQVVLPFNLGIKIPKDDPVRKLNDICESLDYSELNKEYGRSWRKFTPSTLFKILVYGYMNRKYSSRDIEEACKRDICFMWLLNGEPAPDHSTLSRFQNEKLISVISGLFYQVIKRLSEMNEIKFENIFVDGTKIEANANKYTFVWRSVAEKNLGKLNEKIEKVLPEILQRYGIKEKTAVKECLTLLKRQAELTGLKYVYGSGKRKKQLQKDIEYLSENNDKIERYTTYLTKMGDRKSISKTDTDATFMRMKEDYMKNGQLKPGYNIQIGVESEYIVGIGSFSNRSDVDTLTKFLDSVKSQTGKTYKNVIADSGYESEENYEYLKSNGQTTYIKPTNYEISKTRKYKNNVYRAENMFYDEQKDLFVCAEGKELKYVYSRIEETQNKYKAEKRIYRTDTCMNCPNRSKCYNSDRQSRELKVSLKFMNDRRNSLENITSEDGVKLRINRSIQVEGAFGVIKQDFGFRRFLTRGKHKTETQFYLLALAFDIEKLCNRTVNERLNHDLFEIKAA